MNSRVPPLPIRKRLREEVGFGCPIENCRLPFLEYHHFDPKWHEGHRHNEIGMIALCPTHHNFADGDSWTNDDLRQMKRCPTTPVSGFIPWKLSDSILLAGKNYFLGKTISFRILDQEVFHLRQLENGRLIIDALLWDKDGEIIAKIKENDILADHSTVGDLICTAKAAKIRIESKRTQTYLEIGMCRAPFNRFINKLPNHLKDNPTIDLLKQKQHDNRIPIITLRAKIIGLNFSAEVRNSAIEMDFSKIGFDKAKLSGRAFLEGASLNIKVGDREFIYLGP
jgi:hypothetical protein